MLLLFAFFISQALLVDFNLKFKIIWFTSVKKRTSTYVSINSSREFISRLSLFWQISPTANQDKPSWWMFTINDLLDKISSNITDSLRMIFIVYLFCSVIIWPCLIFVLVFFKNAAIASINEDTSYVGWVFVSFLRYKWIII